MRDPVRVRFRVGLVNSGITHHFLGIPSPH